MRFSAIGIFAFMFTMIFFSAPAQAQETIGRGYSVADYRSLVQTYLGFYNGGNPTSDMIDDYAKLSYCKLYKQHFKDDFKWASIQEDLKESFHANHADTHYHYEVGGDIQIDRYDFERKSFPIQDEYQLRNVGKIAIYSPESYFRFCDETGFPEYLPSKFVLSTSKPLNITEVKVPEDKARQIIDHIKIREGERVIFIRFRMEFLDYKTEKLQDKTITTQFHGNITGIDFFLDPQMTQKIYSVDLEKMY